MGRADVGFGLFMNEVFGDRLSEDPNLAVCKLFRAGERERERVRDLTRSCARKVRSMFQRAGAEDGRPHHHVIVYL